MQEAINISKLPIGEQIKLTDDDVMDVKYLRTLETKPKKNLDKSGNAVVPVPYAQMTYAGISFTVNTPEDLAILDNQEGRDDIYSMTLQVTEFDEEVLDAEGNPVLEADGVTPRMAHRRGLSFVSLQTYTSRQAREMKKVTLAGAVHAEKKKFGLIENTANVSEVAKELLKLMEEKEAKAVVAA